MNWLTNFIRPKIRSFVEQKEVPDNLWNKCPACEGMLFSRDLAENLNMCSHCGHHLRISVTERLKLLFDNEQYKTVPVPKVNLDPLKFKDRKKYTDRLKDAQNKTKMQDAIVVAKGTIGGNPVVIAAFNFAFMGGSMGAAVGEGLVAGAQEAVKEGAAFIAIPTSGGARMQEGMISLMQMPRSIIAVEKVKNAGLPYIVLLTDPTTGGVSASFAMVGDIHIAEPGCTIGFAGKRVIQETIREELPEGFQTSEYLQEHGMVDLVVPRSELKETITRILDIVLVQFQDNTPGDKSKASPKKGAPANSNGKAKQKGKKKKAVRPATKLGNVKTRAPANTNSPKKTKQAAQKKS
jgi:acetyl-CoA carboxylase carboxyl transferase subunit beta